HFVTSTGYLPVTDDAFTELFADTGIAETESHKNLYDMMNGMMDSYKLYSLPVYDNASEIQSDFEQNVKLVLNPHTTGMLNGQRTARTRRLY
ncbi:MAG: hypothetical protein IJY73_04420, partial [Oscillospiraceae bacterium]|nr:hypothetical protein [Oscillospiraceae bacterium]